MRIPSGVTDQYIYFVAVDSTDLKTRETGLSSFTVYRSRNGGAAAAYTTPTINETDVTNMPGVYELLLDEDMTIDSGDQSQEVVLHITQASMAPVTRVFELYRPSVTAGETIGVSSGAVSNVTTAAAVTTVNGLAANVITATSIATDAITAGKIAADAIGASELAADAATEIGTAVWATTTRLLTAGTNIALAKGTGVTGFNDLSAAQVNTEVDTAISDAALATAANLATVAGYLDTEIAAILADTNELQTDWADGGRLDLILDARASQTSVDDLPTNAELATSQAAADDATLAAIAALNNVTAAAVADAVWDEALAGHVAAGSAGEALAAAGTAGDPWTTALPGAYGAGTAGKIIGDNLNAPVGTVDTVVDAIKAKTDSLNFTVAGQVDSNVQYVNDVAVNGTGASGDEWGP